MPSNLGVGKHEKEGLHDYCGRRTAAAGAGPTGKERHKGSLPRVLRRHVRHLSAHRGTGACHSLFRVIGAILIIVGAAWGPETRDVDFSEDVQEAEETGEREAETPQNADRSRPHSRWLLDPGFG